MLLKLLDNFCSNQLYLQKIINFIISPFNINFKSFSKQLKESSKRRLFCGSMKRFTLELRNCLVLLQFH